MSKGAFLVLVGDDVFEKALAAARAVHPTTVQPASVQPAGTFTSLFDDAAGASPAETQKVIAKFEQAMQGTDAPGM